MGGVITSGRQRNGGRKRYIERRNRRGNGRCNDRGHGKDLKEVGGVITCGRQGNRGRKRYNERRIGKGAMGGVTIRVWQGFEKCGRGNNFCRRQGNMGRKRYNDERRNGRGKGRCNNQGYGKDLKEVGGVITS